MTKKTIAEVNDVTVPQPNLHACGYIPILGSIVLLFLFVVVGFLSYRLGKSKAIVKPTSPFSKTLMQGFSGDKEKVLQQLQKLQRSKLPAKATVEPTSPALQSTP